MTTRYLNIEAKHRRGPGFIAGTKDFTTSEGEQVDSEIIIRNPNTSLYCFDDDAKRAIFVELPPNINLTTVPFVYFTQHEEAQRLIAVPYDAFRNIAKTLPAVEHLIMMYISGRSGSTLLSHIFNQLDSVMSLSEPDVITQFVHMRDDNHQRDAELRELFDCTVRILFKPNPYKKPATYALKYRMETLRAMDLFHETFPHAKNLYSYRDAAGFVASFYRIFKTHDAPETMPLSDFIASFNSMFRYDLTPKTIYLDPNAEQISIIQQMTLWWMVGIEWYLEQTASGIPILPVRYADLNQHREKVVTEIFKYCNLPVDKVSQSLSPFERDSQSGSPIARENPKEGNKYELTDEQQQEMTRILARHPVIKQSDFIVPDTLRV